MQGSRATAAAETDDRHGARSGQSHHEQYDDDRQRGSGRAPAHAGGHCEQDGGVSRPQFLQVMAGLGIGSEQAAELLRDAGAACLLPGDRVDLDKFLSFVFAGARDAAEHGVGRIDEQRPATLDRSGPAPSRATTTTSIVTQAPRAQGPALQESPRAPQRGEAAYFTDGPPPWEVSYVTAGSGSQPYTAQSSSTPTTARSRSDIGGGGFALADDDVPDDTDGGLGFSSAHSILDYLREFPHEKDVLRYIVGEGDEDGMMGFRKADVEAAIAMLEAEQAESVAGPRARGVPLAPAGRTRAPFQSWDPGFVEECWDPGCCPPVAPAQAPRTVCATAPNQWGFNF